MSARRLSATLAGFWALAACGSDIEDPDPDRLRQPAGLATSPDGRWLFVAGGNFDQAQSAGTLMVLDLDRAFAAMADGQCPPDGDGVARCDDGPLIDGGQTVRLGSAVGNIAVDAPDPAGGRLRLLVPVRLPPAVVWVDAVVGEAGATLDCGQDAEGVCDDEHTITAVPDDPDSVLPGDPARVILDDQGFRFAYVPHLLGGSISLIALDGEFGPELTDVEPDFYADDPFEDLEVAGGFSVAQRACDPADPPRASRDCARPLLYTTHRFWPGVRSFTIAPGLDVILPGDNQQLSPLDPELVESRPFMGGLAFEDPALGESLLVVQTEPPGLARVDTRLDDGEPINALASTVGLCTNPNQVEVYRPAGGESLALVSCFGAASVAVVGLGTFSVLGTVAVGDGPNEIAVDAGRGVAFVANSRDSSVSIVGLDRTRSDFLREIARIGGR